MDNESCAVCNKQIEHNYVLYNGLYYHINCYLLWRAYDTGSPFNYTDIPGVLPNIDRAAKEV